MTAQSVIKPLWQHPYPKTTRLDAFRRHVNLKYNFDLKTYMELHKWSVDNVEAFNTEIWSFCGLTYSAPPIRVANGLENMWPPPQWFPGAKLNYSENLLATGLATHSDAIAISACREGGTGWRHLTWRQLRDQVLHYACALAKVGVVQGDRVAAVLTNSLEAVLLLIATGWLGGIFSSIAPDMGASGILERFIQIQPKVMFVESAIKYAGKDLDLRPKFGQVIEELEKKGVKVQMIVDIANQTWGQSRTIRLHDFLNIPVVYIDPLQLPFDHPIYILYTSGTTGPPKCICHAGGRALLQQRKEYALQMDMGPESTYFQYTTIGWMMWNYLVGALSTGARIILYDGSPMYPTPAYQIQVLEEQGVTHWGTSPKFLSALKQGGLRRQYKLDNLQCIGVSGSPLSAELSHFVYAWAPRHVGLFSGSGGTDLVGGIVGGNPLSKIYAGELAAPYLGMKMEILGSNRKNITEAQEAGELIITAPFLSMPVTFWGKNGMEKYRAAYFDLIPGVWGHGDLIRRNTVTGGYEILGRSDGVLNPNGVRFGTAEIYGILDKFDQVEDYIAVGQRRHDDPDEQVLLFLKMRSEDLDARVRDQIATAIRTQLSPRHVPAYIIQIKDIPYTMNGKRIENLVRNIVSGRPAQVGGTAINPECLDEYRQFTTLPRVADRPKL